jgi:cellulose synthase/poly-beta-1,6-N-acetylglucosamine synthase-like glycosyltransferase
VVVAEADQFLWIAVPDPELPGLAASLATAARRPVRLVAAGPDELALALANSRSIGNAQVLRRLRLRSLVAALGLGHVLDAMARALLDGTETAEGDVALAISAKLPDRWGLELLGLLDGLPHLASAAQMRAPLRLLLPPSMRNAPAGPPMVPWCLEGDVLVLACSSLPSERQLAAIVSWSGFQPRPVLAEADKLRDALLSTDVQADTPPAKSRVSRQARRWDSTLDAALRRQAVALARQAGVTEAEAARRIAGDNPPREVSTALNPSPEALALVPPPLARSLLILPLRLMSDYLEVALGTDTTDEAEVAAAIAMVTGHAVRIRRVSPADLQASQAHAYHARPQLPSRPSQVAELGAILDAANTTSDSGREEARRRDRIAVEALGAQQGLPVIRLEHYATPPEVAESAPLALLQRLCAVPVHREGRVLWVAFARPSEAAILELAGVTGVEIRPLVASAAAIRARLAVLQARPAIAQEGQIPRLASPILDHLLGRGVLTHTDVLALPVGPRPALDEALDARRVLTHAQFAELAARLSGHPQADLQLQPREESIIDALGQRSRRTIWEDPVDPEVVALLSPETVRERGMLPFRREGDTLLVAAADPFCPATKAALAMLAGDKLVLVVAPRPAILTALSRARGLAPLGERLMAQGILSAEELTRALHLHRSSGVRLGQALLYLNLISQEQLAYFLAEQKDFGYFSLEGMEVDGEVARLLPEEVERRLGAVPLYALEEELVVATPDPANQTMLDEVAARTGQAVLPIVCTERDFEALLEAVYRDDYLQRSTSDLVVRTPEESASVVLSAGQRIALMIAGLLLIALVWRVPVAAGIGLTGLCSLFYIVFSVYRCYLIARALSHDLEVPVSADELAALDEASLPVYTILVPLYREASVLPTLLLGLSRLDYPATKLDVKLLLEEDDTETLAVVEATALPSYVHPVVVPAAHPRGKPKACNYGLIHAHGTYVVIFDAEDVPDPDQLKTVVVAFRKSSPEVACMQAKLNYYNSNQNLLTRWFTTEYSMWFDLFLPGLDAAKLPVPLGGTSNHFITDRLREAGAWDPYNVTEDADLGIRLFRRGWRTAVIDSTTYEEANSEVYNWIRQRSRWVKGYIQTFLVHMRHPVRLWRTVGTRSFFCFLMVVGGTCFGFLMNPVFWCLTSLWYLAHAGFIRLIYPPPIFYLGALSLFIGNFAFVYINVAGSLRRQYFDLVRYALLSPLYWALMSLAAWKGFIQLWTKPFHWEKTTHGLYKRKGKRSA